MAKAGARLSVPKDVATRIDQLRTSRWTDDPANVRPMLATLADAPLAQPGLIYEPKLDGIRALVDLRPGKGGYARIYSRNGNDKTLQFPGLAKALETFAAKLSAPLLIDGEVTALDRDGKALGFQHLQGRLHLKGEMHLRSVDAGNPAALFIFDILREGHDDLRGLPTIARRLRLERAVKPPASLARLLRITDIAIDDGRAMYTRALEEGWEGLIVKDGMGVYESGRRSPAWRKLKVLHEQELVIGGWTEPRLSRHGFGALLVGYYENAGKAPAKLVHAGSVGTGFDGKELDRVYRLLRARETTTSPFKERIKTRERQHFVTPQLVAQIKFTEWTHEGYLRQPVYLGLRDDKPARSVIREEKSRTGLDDVDLRGHLIVVKTKDRRPKTKETKAAKAPAVTTRGRAKSAEAPLANAGVIAQLDEIQASKKDGVLQLPDGQTLRVTNLSKIFWPVQKITKGDLLRYYAEIAPFILPAVDDRPMVMKRFPNGIEGPAFYQQRHKDDPPPGVRVETLPKGIEPITPDGGSMERIIGGDLVTLLYMTQIASISEDPWFSRVGSLQYADFAAIDLDPGDGATFKQVLDTARAVKEELDRFGIPGVPKTSGSSGIHIYVPLPPKTSYDTGQLLTQIVATIVATKYPKFATVERMVKRRPRGTVYVDYLQNILGKTIATAYSARASDFAGVSTPLTWDEVEHGVSNKDFTLLTYRARFRAMGDLWKKVRTMKPVNIEKVLARIEKGK
ncbi:MAG: DNA ligase D [Acidobacteriota bacterium]|nr:DNA ligase D [Acidobacteriota bacterium]